jgi:hypothetical protein
MIIRNVRESSIEKLEQASTALVVGCGYEHRSQGITSLLKKYPEEKIALCFSEFSDVIARGENERFFKERGFALQHLSGNSPEEVRSIVNTLLTNNDTLHGIAFDISTMTRAWHGAIVRQLRIIELPQEVTTFFAYVPAKFQLPPKRPSPNEFVGPVDGFTSLGTPDLPVAAIIGLGYEKEGALGLQQLIDPQLTVLMVPKSSGEHDPFFKRVLQSNRDVIGRTLPEWIFEYDLAEPASTFSMLASIIGGLIGNYRIVLASLGPKIFGIICFLLATKFPDLSVWRVSAGVHGQPRDSEADLDRVVVLEVTWQPFLP